MFRLLLAAALLFPNAAAGPGAQARLSASRSSSDVPGMPAGVDPDPTQWSGLRYRLIGPYRGGRATSVAGIAGKPGVYYFGAAAGGVFRTDDGGVTWTPTTDGQPFSAVGALALAPSDPDVLYVGTGEACIRGNVVHGNGVYGSRDGGRTWRHLGLADTQHIGRIAVHPAKPDTVFVAALGHAYGENEERGIFRSTDAGQHWTKVLYHDARTGGIDIAMDPRDPDVLLAALWQAGRTPYGLTSGGPGSGLYRSADGGTTWQRLSGGGLPEGPLGRIGVAFSPAAAGRVFAVVEAGRGGLYRSDDNGRTWQLLNESRELLQRAWYFAHVVADPASADVVYVLNISLMRSKDGGRTFERLTGLHADHHALWIDPRDPTRLIAGNDGGANVSMNGGRTWSRSDNTQPTAQFYHVAVDTRAPYSVYGAQQDFETIAIPSRTDGPGISEADWYEVGGCEMGFVLPHPADPDIVYAGCTDGGLTRYDHRTRRTTSIEPWPETAMGHGAADQKYRFQWTAPTAISPHDPEVLYHGGNVLFESRDRGRSWRVISPDLTRNDKSRQQPSGGPITRDNVGTEFYCTIFAVAESAREKGAIWVGSDDGLVHLTRDGGTSWTNVTPHDLPEWSLVSAIEPSRHDAGVAYLAVDRHELDDLRPYVYKTTDYGRTWTSIAGDLPQHTFVHVIREDPVRRGLLYAGTDEGVFVSFDDGARWTSLQLNLPVVPVHDLVVAGDDLVLATHGRSFWILDDLTPLRVADAGLLRAGIVPPRPATRVRAPLRSAGPAMGENPPVGALVSYVLDSEPSGELTLAVRDAGGQVVRRFSSQARPDIEPAAAAAPLDVPVRLTARRGLNRFAWNLRLDPPKAVPGVLLFWHPPIYPPVGPLALPGTYTLELTADGRTFTAPLEVQADARTGADTDALRAQFDLLVNLRERFTALTGRLVELDTTRKKLAALRARIGTDVELADVAKAAGDVDAKLAAIEGALTERRTKSGGDHFHYPVQLDNKLSLLIGVVANADERPTAQALAVAQELETRISAELARLTEVMSRDVPALNRLARARGLPELGRF